MIGGAEEVKTCSGRMIQANSLETRDFTPLEGFESALDWWREAGVDCDFAEEPVEWLAKPEADDAVATPPPPPPKPPARVTPLQRALAGGAAEPVSAELPDTLEKFREWWMTEPSLAPGALDQRLPPRGIAEAKLMVLVEQPAPDDGDTLLSGGTAKLLRAILNAIGVAEHETYLASALPAPMQLPDWGDLAARGLGSAVSHHIALAKPQRVLAFGRGQLTLFGIEAERGRDPLSIECGGTPVPLLAAPDLSQIARSAPRRQRLWHRWLEWTA